MSPFVPPEPPLEPDAPTPPPELNVPLPPPEVGLGSPFVPADAENRDRILDWWRAWWRRVFFPWIASWGGYWSLQWLNVINYLNTWFSAAEEYITENAASGLSWQKTNAPIASSGSTNVEIIPVSPIWPLRVGDLVSDTTDNSNYGVITSVIDTTHATVLYLGSLRGAPGPNTIPTDVAVSGLVRSSTSLTRASLIESLALTVPIYGAGIDPTGVADSTAAIQAIIDAHPGRALILPEGVYKITALTLSQGQTLTGVGQQTWRDRALYYGDPEFLDNANFNGTVIRTTLSSGSAITISDTEVNSGGLADFTIIGPGTGSSTGITVGGTAPSHTVVNGHFNNVKICNFTIGIRTVLAQECSFYNIMLRGCLTGASVEGASNNNAWYLLDLETCGNGLITFSSTTANAFYSLIAQACTATGVTISGVKNVLYNPYFEQNATYAVDFTSACIGCGLHDGYFNNPSDTIRIQPGAIGTNLTGFGDTNVLVNNLGVRTYMQGSFTNLTNFNNTAIIVDAGLAGSPFAPWLAYTPTVTGITIGNGTIVGRWSRIGKKVSVELTFTVGSTSVMTGKLIATLPIAAQSAENGRPAQALILKQGLGWVNAMAYITAGQITAGYASYTDGLINNYSASAPVNWAAGDIITLNTTYETI